MPFSFQCTYWIILYFAVSFPIKSHCLTLTTSLLLIGVSQKEASTDTLSLILTQIDFTRVLKTFLKGNEKIWLKFKVSSSCSCIHSLSVPGDKEQFLHSTKITSYSLCSHITQISNTASQPELVLLIFTLTFSFMVDLVTAVAGCLPGAWNIPSNNPWWVPLEANKPCQKKNVRLHSAETPGVSHKANTETPPVCSEILCRDGCCPTKDPH